MASSQDRSFSVDAAFAPPLLPTYGVFWGLKCVQDVHPMSVVPTTICHQTFCCAKRDSQIVEPVHIEKHRLAVHYKILDFSPLKSMGVAAS